jgi:acyl-coenzyme A synthetase/AMP-(fatty) acid ligase
VESAALDVPGVEQAACRPPGPDGRLVLWITGSAAPDAVLHGIAVSLGPAARPDTCVRVARMPLTPNGKIDRAALEEGPEGD